MSLAGFKVGERRLLLSCTLVLTAVALGWALHFMKPIMVPLVLAILLSYLVNPLVDLIQVRLHIPRPIAIVLALIFAALVMAFVAFLLVYSIKDLAGNSKFYEQKFVDLGSSALTQAQSMGIPVDTDTFMAELRTIEFAPMLLEVFGDLLDSISTFLLVLICIVYIVAGRTPYANRKGIYKEIDHKIRKYLIIKVTVSLITAIIVGVALELIGMPLAVVFAVLTFLLNFIPSIGSVIAIILPLPVALVHFDSLGPVLMVLLIPGTFQFVIGNVLEPQFMGESLNLHPITVLLSLIFWGMIWGLAGMVLAAPITAVLKIVLERIEATRAIANVLAGNLPGEADA